MLYSKGVISQGCCIARVFHKGVIKCLVWVLYSKAVTYARVVARVLFSSSVYSKGVYTVLLRCCIVRAF